MTWQAKKKMSTSNDANSEVQTLFFLTSGSQHLENGRPKKLGEKEYARYHNNSSFGKPPVEKLCFNLSNKLN